MSRYEARLLELQMAAEQCDNEVDRALILGELAAMQEAVKGTEQEPEQLLSVFSLRRT